MRHFSYCHFPQLVIEGKLLVKDPNSGIAACRDLTRVLEYSSQRLEVALNENGSDLGGWWVGLSIGVVVVVIVVILVGTLLVLAARINTQARAAAGALEATRTTTQPLVELRRTNDTLQSILRGARAARKALGG